MIESQEKTNKIKAIDELLDNRVSSRVNLMALKRRLSRKYGIPLLSSPEILEAYRNKLAQGKIVSSPALEKLLRKRTIRTMSGIAPVAVLTRAYPCPGKCAYCPKEKDMPQSYLSNEPAVMRAVLCGFDPYKQVRFRLEALEANGHEPTKIELIVIGGTWSALPVAYKCWYITQCFRAANEYGKQFSPLRTGYGGQAIFNFQFSNNFQLSNFQFKKLKQKLLSEQRKNEKAKYKIIGITLETRPDYINEKELLEMRELGATRVELGVQAIDDEILKLNRRGHGVEAVATATELLKNYGFKVTYHIMPGLPGSTAKKDLAMFKQLFSDQRFQPDQIKFYPTVVTRGSLLYRWWRAGKYKPYSDKVLQKLIVECKKIVPPYVRIIRLIRDIPKESIMAGNTITNLRQIMKDRGVVCRCIRCREAKELKIKNYELRVIKYEASGGEEYFLSYESKDGKTLYGFCRLRLTARSAKRVTHNVKTPFPPAGGPLYQGGKTALIRELHVYGELVSVGGRKKVQHAGLGKRLMLEAEKIARENGYEKMAVISGVGVRGYYRKLGYKLKDSYMIKKLV